MENYRAKIYFGPLPWNNQKQQNENASQSELKAIQLFAPFSFWLAAFQLKIVLEPSNENTQRESRFSVFSVRWKGNYRNSKKSLVG